MQRFVATGEFARARPAGVAEAVKILSDRHLKQTFGKVVEERQSLR
jgi:hypothetical protein